MQSEYVIPGRWIPREEPDWTGLEALLPLELCGPFMWMGAIELEDGAALGSYKHRITRRCFHLDGSGTTYAYRGEAGYCRVRHYDAVEHVFDPSWLLHWSTEGDRHALKAALGGAADRDRRDFEAGRALPARRI